MRSVLVWVILALTFAPGVVVGPTARADDAEREVWLFEREGVIRELDVTDLDADIRARLVLRLAEDGFLRRERPSRDLRSDVATLVAHGGRFPASGAPSEDGPGRASVALPAATQELELLLRRAARLLTELRATEGGARRLATLRERLAPLAASPEADGHALGCLLQALGGAPHDDGGAASFPRMVRSHLWGATLRVDLGPGSTGGREGGALVVAVEPRSLAAALGLAAGDRILALDGRVPRPRTLTAWARTYSWKGQRRIEVRRRSGEVDTLDLRCESPRSNPGRDEAR